MPRQNAAAWAPPRQYANRKREIKKHIANASPRDTAALIGMSAIRAHARHRHTSPPLPKALLLFYSAHFSRTTALPRHIWELLSFRFDAFIFDAGRRRRCHAHASLGTHEKVNAFILKCLICFIKWIIDILFASLSRIELPLADEFLFADE